MTRRQITLFLSSLLVTLLLSLGPKAISPAIAQPPSLLVGASSSLEGALKEIDFIFKAANTGIAVKYNFAASGILQQQIEEGAPIDVFISASGQQMNALQQKELILSNTRQNLLTNRLVLVVPASSNSDIDSFRQLANPEVKRIAMGDPRNVAAGQYAKEVFEKLGIWDKIQPKLLFSSSIRGVLGAVASGNVDAGIVYATDAKSSNQVEQVATAPKSAHSPIVYPVAVVRASRNPSIARTYIKFLQSSEAQTIFKNYGFGIAE